MVIFLLSGIHLSFVYHCDHVLLGLLGKVLKRRIGFFLLLLFSFSTLSDIHLLFVFIYQFNELYLLKEIQQG